MEIENKENLSSFLIGEVLLCGLLGRILYEDPNRDWLEQLVREDVFSEIPLGAGQLDIERSRELLSQWSQKYQSGLTDEEFAAIQTDQLYLFFGVQHSLAPIWESVYFNEDRLLFQEQTLQVREWYARFNLQFEHLGTQPDDHIGIEFSFVAHLAALSLQSLENGDGASAKALLQNQRDFLSEHLLIWASYWADLVQKSARTDFYRGLSILACGALETIAQELQIKIPEKEVL
jgi:TorA maturation chaperone TorD